jgi:iron complex outermembrane receptor protein
LYYATYAIGFRPGGANNPVPQAACQKDFQAFGITESPPTFGSDTVNSFEVGAKNNIDNRVKIASSIYYIRWNNIQQSVLPPTCQITFIANLGTAVAKGGDIQAEIAVTDNFTAEIATGYTSARYTQDSKFSPGELKSIVSKGDAIVGQSGEPPGQPGAPFTVTLGLEYKFNLFNLPSFVRIDDEYQSRNKWPPAAQDSTTQQFSAAFYTLSSTNLASARAGMTFGNWQAAAFVDNLTDTHTVTNYNFTIYPGDASRLERQFTFRPRTMGLTITYRN